MPEIIVTPSGLATEVRVGLAHGVHSRPSARLAQAARSFDAHISLATEDGEVDASSMLDILSLAIPAGASVRILASGPQAREALCELARLLTAPGV